MPPPELSAYLAFLFYQGTLTPRTVAIVQVFRPAAASDEIHCCTSMVVCMGQGLPNLSNCEPVKLEKQTFLHFQEGNSDKVYEVDLCEVGTDRYVVNFRYGRRDSTLREGTKTASSVSRSDALGIYDSLVSEKLGKGYREVAATSFTSSSEPIVATASVANDLGDAALTPREQGILDRLSQGPHSNSEWPLSRAVWRAGEARLRVAEPLLVSFLGTNEAMLNYAICWALGQCGSRASMSALETVVAEKKHPMHVRRIAAESIRLLADDSQLATITQHWLALLPAKLQPLAQNGPVEQFQQTLSEVLESDDLDGPNALELIYRIDNEHVRPALLSVLRTAPLVPGYFRRMRHIFKAAELRRDGEVFGILAKRFETTRPNWSPQTGYYVPPAHEQRKPTLGAQPEKAFGRNTREYFRRRSWRTLFRLGELNSVDYVRIATGVLLAFSDDDGVAPQQTVRYDWSSYRPDRGYQTVTTHRDAFSNYWALNQILYRHSPRYQPTASHTTFSCVPPYEPGQPAPAAREEAFPDLWEAQPDLLLKLLTESHCRPVHEFAVKAIRTCSDFCNQIAVDVLILLLESAYESTVQWAFELAVARYDPGEPDRDLVLALANCGVQAARNQAHTWIQDQLAVFFSESNFIVALLGSPHADTRSFARTQLLSARLDATQSEAIIGRLFAMLTTLGGDGGPQAADIAATLLQAFGDRLRQVSAEVIRDLLKHPLSDVQQLAGNLVLSHEIYAQQPPEDVLRALLNSEHVPVRTVGIRIIGQLPDEVLIRSVELLVALTRHALPDVRGAVRPIVKRIAESDLSFGRAMAARLVDALLVPGAPDGVPSHTARVLCEDLRAGLSVVSGEMVWKLLRSRSTPAQEVGGVTLAYNISAEDLSVSEIVRLADHEILSVREAAWKICRESLSRLRTEMVETVRILDVKQDDSRQFAFELFRDHFQGDELSVEVLVNICDSVRPEVQRFGRDLIVQRFDPQHGPEYLAKLSEHPSVNMQLFASNFLEEYAAGNQQRLLELEPYFLSVLCRVNQGRVAKQRVLGFLLQQSSQSAEAARLVAGILSRQSATCAIGDKARTIEAMIEIQSLYPEIELPISLKPVEARGGV